MRQRIYLKNPKYWGTLLYTVLYKDLKIPFNFVENGRKGS